MTILHVCTFEVNVKKINKENHNKADQSKSKKDQGRQRRRTISKVLKGFEFGELMMQSAYINDHIRRLKDMHDKIDRHR